MKAICIGDKNKWLFTPYPKKLLGFITYKPKPKRIKEAPEYGEEVTVVEKYTSDYVHGFPIEYYLLLEYPEPGGFDARYFIPLSDISETEFERKEQSTVA